MPENKNRQLYILKYLWENTDDYNPATINDIVAYLASVGIEVNRRTVPTDIAELQGFGFDIICNKSTQNQYFIGDRVFELPELKLLVDAVQSAQFISAGKSKSLVKKLSAMASNHQASQLNRRIYIDKRIKTQNENIYYTVDKLQNAIIQKKKITFKYYEYTQNKEKVFKHNGKVYSFSPYDLVWNDD